MAVSPKSPWLDAQCSAAEYDCGIAVTHSIAVRSKFVNRILQRPIRITACARFPPVIESGAAFGQIARLILRWLLEFPPRLISVNLASTIVGRKFPEADSGETGLSPVQQFR